MSPQPKRPPGPSQPGLDLGSLPAAPRAPRVRPRSRRPTASPANAGRQLWAPVGGRDYDGLASGRYLFVVEQAGQISVETRSGAVLWRARGALDEPAIWAELGTAVAELAAVLRLDVHAVRADLERIRAWVLKAAALRAALDGSYSL